MPQKPFFFIQACCDPQVTFCSSIPYVKFYKVSFGGRNLLAYLLMDITVDVRLYNKESHRMH